MPESSPVLSVTPDFHVTWRDPDDAEYSWLLDDAHYDRPMPAMAQEMFAAIMRGQGRRSAFLNGYAYALNRGPTLPGPEMEGRDVFQVWLEEYLPRIKAGCAAIRSRDYAALPADELARALPDIFAEAAALHYLTMTVVQPFLAPAMALLEFCEANLEEDAGALAATVLQESHNATSAAAMALGELAQLARERPPEVARLVREGDVDALRTVAGGREFCELLDAFLQEFGWRAERWSALHIPTWAESPRVALMLIARFLDRPETSPDVTLARAGEGKLQAMAAIEAKLAPDRLREFRSLVERCSAHVPMSEERSYCQLLIWGSLRVPVVELGRRLVAAGALDDANDVAYLSTDEAAGAAGRPDRLQATVAQRKRDLEAWGKLTPPLHVGRPAAARTLNQTQKLFIKHFRGPEERIPQEGGVIRGLAASQGVVKATARVIRDLQDSERLRPGDVLVCGVTSAPWTPLFAIAGAVVTDAGGILAHSAICAREYGIAAVVGTSVGTRVIPDGATITVDGTAGTVTIEE